REKLLSQGPELTLDKATDVARSHELAQLQLKAMASDNHDVHAVRRRAIKQACRPNDGQKISRVSQVKPGVRRPP
ncbi:hypothetical protein XENOCAPTIV_010652, partial [Xenoophorus captivus]